MNISTPQATPDHPDVGRIQIHHLGGCLLALLGGLLTLAGVISLVYGISLFVIPSPDNERVSLLIGSVIFFTPGVMIGIPLLILGLISLFRKPKAPPPNPIFSSIPSFTETLYSQNRAERGGIRNGWGWVLTILGWLGIVWSSTWTLSVLIDLVFRPTDWETTVLGGVILLAVGLIIGIPLLLVGIRMVRRKMQTSQPIQSPFIHPLG